MSFFNISLVIALVAMVIVLMLVFYRIMTGPSMMDRIIAFDLLTADLIGIVTVYGIFVKEEYLFDVNLALALTGFLSILGLAIYMHKKTWHEGDN